MSSTILIYSQFVRKTRWLRCLSSPSWKAHSEIRRITMKCSLIIFTVLTVLIPIPVRCQRNSTSAASMRSASSASDLSASEPSSLQERNPRYQLQKDDTFEVDFAFSPELNQTVAVQPDGYATLKEIGSVLVEGKTIPELTETLKIAYAKILHDPVITIILKDFEKPYFVASGQVAKPGKYDLRGDITVTEGVAIAGGFTQASKHSQVVVYRPEANGLTEVRVINVKKLLRSHELSEDIHLRPGDMIYVPQNGISKISRYLPTSSLGLYGYPGTF